MRGMTRASHLYHRKARLSCFKAYATRRLASMTNVDGIETTYAYKESAGINMFKDTCCCQTCSANMSSVAMRFGYRMK